jgi:hypothetical protein
MENVEKKYVSVEIYRDSLTYLFQVDKSLDLDELDEDEFRTFVNERFYEDINDYSLDIESYSSNSMGMKIDSYLFKSGDTFDTGTPVPNNTKSIIQYTHKLCDEDNNLVNGGKTIKENLEVFLSSTSEETLELWKKGDIKSLSNYFLTNNFNSYSWIKKEYEPDDKGTLQLIYDEKDNPVHIQLLDVNSYQRDGRSNNEGELLNFL